ncbi:LOW QUALITY PROTEIN: kinesin-like protein KIF20B [Strix uralensis]|uniref:LOW QUALITY PROTEIN: kinesin-like protein KIF20B n=1 Tax=Strix uralensis TaxID=36305 RepID=UPI003DA354CD
MVSSLMVKGGERSQQHIPFQESKLTHFLQGFFSAKGKVYVMVNISQCASAYDETLHVLKFSATAQKMLLSLTEELKNKLTAEKKNKLLLELQIREEVMQEFAQYFAELEIYFNECLSYEQERLEEDADMRLEIFKELVDGYLEDMDEENKLKDQPCSEQAGPLSEEYGIGPGTYIDLEGVTDSLQNDVVDIKKQAEETHRHVVSLEDPQEATGWLEKQLAKKTNELIKIEEQLTQKTKDFEMQMIKWDESAEQLKEPTEKMNTQNERIQELVDIVEQKDHVTMRLQDLISRLEKNMKDYDNTVTTMKRKFTEKNSNEVTESSQFKDCEETVLEVGRKRCSESKAIVEKDPPAEKGGMKESWEDDSLDQKRTEYVKANNTENYAELLALKERIETLEGQLAAPEEQCRREKKKKEFSGQIKNLNLKLSASEERASGLGEEFQQCRADHQEIVSELDKQKTINREQEEKIIQLNNKVEGAKQNIIYKVPLIKTMQSKVDELYKCHLESYTTDIDSVNLKDSLDSQKDELERASSQKSQQIQEPLQQVEDLKKGLDDAENYNNQLKIKLNETANQDHQSTKEKDLMNQLQEHIQKKTQDFGKQAAEDHRVIALFEEEVTSSKGKIRELECLLEAFRAKDDSIAKLEEVLKEKESIILNLESNTAALQEECANSDKKLKELNDQEANVKEEVVQLMNSLENMKHTLQEKEKNEDEQIQSIELLRKDLSESSALVQSLKKDLQRKEEENADLKEKLSDATKQIQQVHKEQHPTAPETGSGRESPAQLYPLGTASPVGNTPVSIGTTRQLCSLSAQGKLTLSWPKSGQCAKEKLIEDLRMALEEQEQTQIKQGQVLEAKLEETNSLTDRKNWLEEKMRLISQVKEAESHRNREMRKFAEARKRCVEQQAEIERLGAQLVEKASNLQKWCEERDQLVEFGSTALEVQPKTLASNTIQKDKEIAELKQAAVKDSGKDEETDTEELRKQVAEKDDFIKELKQGVNHKSLQSLAEVPLPEGQDKIDQSVNKEFMEKQSRTNPVLGQSIPVRYDEVKGNYSLSRCPGSASSLSEDHSAVVLHSSEVSTENGNTSQFPKPEVEMQFTALQPSKMEVKHQGSTLPVPVKMLKPRKKRKSEEMDEMSSTKLFKKEYPLRKQGSTSRKLSAKNKDGTLQKIGDFFQSSPIIIHSKAKKLMATISSPKSAEPESAKGKELKPARAKRKLCSSDSSCPLDVPDSSIFIEQKRRKVISQSSSDNYAQNQRYNLQKHVCIF